jgi:hypothetical protein
MENLSTFWVVVWPKVIDKILFVWGPMSSCVLPLKPKNKDQSFNPSYVFIHYFLVSFFFSFLFPSQDISKKLDHHGWIQTQDSCNSYVFMVIWHVIIVVVALQQLSFHQHNSAMMMMLFSLCFHHSQTSIEVQ